VKNYCGCDICEEDKKEGGQRKDRSEIKSGGLRKIGNHGRSIRSLRWLVRVISQSQEGYAASSQV